MSKPRIETLLSGATERAPSGRNDAGLWLACQLRDNGYTIGEAETAMREYAAAVGHSGDHEYTEAEAVATVRSAFTKPAREPWHRPPSRNGDRRENAKPGTEPPKFKLMSSPDFAAAKYKLQWLSKPVLVKGQPAIIGGPMKVLKTSMAVDLAVSLSTGTPFLGEFHPPKCDDGSPQVFKVAMLSGESGEAVLQETAKRICHARMRVLSDCKIWWGFRLPQLARFGDLSALSDALQENAIDVLILDPLYLSLLAGDSEGRSASNLFDMGPLLLAVAEMAAACGCTAILLHHFKKTLADPFAPAELPDLAYSGVAEFARQWLLLSRRQEYEPGSGEHRLWLSVGGSAGHGGLWAIDAREGATGDDFTGRKWEVNVKPATQARADEKTERETDRRQASVEKVFTMIGRYPEGESLSYLAQAAGISNGKFGDIATELENAGRVARCNVAKPCGKGTRNVPGYRPTEAHPDTRTTPGQSCCPGVATHTRTNTPC